MTTGWQEIAHGVHYRQDDGAVVVTDYLGNGDTEFVARHPKGPVKNYRRSDLPRFDTLNQAKKAITGQYPLPGSEPVLKFETLKARKNPGPPPHFSSTMDPKALKIVGLLRQKPELLFNVLTEIGQVKMVGPWRRPNPEHRKNTEVIARYEPGGCIVHAVYLVGIGLPGNGDTHGASAFPGNTVVEGMVETDKGLRDRGYILIGNIPKNVAGPWIVNSRGWRRWRDNGTAILASVTTGKEVNGDTFHCVVTPHGTLCDEGLGFTANNVIEAKKQIDKELRDAGWVVPTE